VTAGTTTGYVLSITVTGGEGYAEYHFDTTPYTRYTKSVEIEEGADVFAKIVPSDGYEFVRWAQSSTSTDTEIFFGDVHSDITLTAELKSSDSGSNGGDILDSWWVVIAAALLALLALLLLFLVLRRRYDLIKISSENVIINGKDKVYRKRAYKFTVEGTFIGLRYRIGDVAEDEEPVWKQPLKTDDGYEIPREDVTDNITLEAY
jgi:MYXO-CTERM domain-containing protein